MPKREQMQTYPDHEHVSLDTQPLSWMPYMAELARSVCRYGVRVAFVRRVADSTRLPADTLIVGTEAGMWRSGCAWN